jgi:hypothetical protein
MDFDKIRAYLVSDMGCDPEQATEMSEADVLNAIRVETQTAGDSMLDEIGCSAYEVREIRILEKLHLEPPAGPDDPRVVSLGWMVQMWELLTGGDALELIKAWRGMPDVVTNYDPNEPN